MAETLKIKIKKITRFAELIFRHLICAKIHEALGICEQFHE